MSDEKCPNCGEVHEGHHEMFQLTEAIIRLCNECDDLGAVLSALMVTVVRVAKAEDVNPEDQIAAFVHTIGLVYKRNEVDLYLEAINRSAMMKMRSGQ